MYLLAIDPSIVSPGVAVFQDGTLVYSARIKVRATNDNIAVRCHNAARAIMEATAAYVKHAVAFEWPQIYERDTPAIANKVIPMAGVDMALLAMLYIEPHQVHAYLPAEVWGQLPKHKTGSYWLCPRGIRVKSRLEPAELAIAVDQHDAGDAIGIGLHQLGRLGLRRVFTSA